MNQEIRWQEPLPSRATRKIPRKSTHHFVGELTFGEETGAGRRVGFESKLEYEAALMLLYHADTADLEEQVAPVSYVDITGTHRPHTFDFRVTHHDSKRSAVSVKPACEAKDPAFQEKMRRVAAAAVPRTAGEVFIVTERNIDPLLLDRAKLFHAARHPQPELDARLREHLAEYVGTARMRDLLSDAGVGDVGFHAAVRCIRKRVLHVISQGPITLSSVLASPGDVSCL